MGNLVIDFFLCRKRKSKLQKWNCSGDMECKKHEWINYIDFLVISELKQIRVRHFQKIILFTILDMKNKKGQHCFHRKDIERTMLLYNVNNDWIRSITRCWKLQHNDYPSLCSNHWGKTRSWQCLVNENWNAKLERMKRKK